MSHEVNISRDIQNDLNVNDLHLNMMLMVLKDSRAENLYEGIVGNIVSFNNNDNVGTSRNAKDALCGLSLSYRMILSKHLMQKKMFYFEKEGCIYFLSEPH